MLVLAGPGPLGAGAAEVPPVFAVRTAGGTSERGAWHELKADWSARVGDTAVPGADVLSVRRTEVPLPPLPAEDHLVLANGDRVPFRTLRLEGEKFRLRHANLEGGEEASLPLSAVSLWWHTAPEGTLDAEKLRRRLLSGTRARDTVCLRNGDVVAGVLTELDATDGAVDVEGRRVKFKAPQVAYVAFNTELADRLRPRGVHARLVLLGNEPGRGGRLSVTKAAADGTALTATTAFGARLRVPLRDVASLDLYQGRAVYLSDLKPADYTFRPYLDAAWPYAADGNVAEHALLLGGSTYDKGVGLHSHGRLTYRLAGAYRRFEAQVGLDDRDGRRGSARVRVLADGAVRLDREVTGGVVVPVEVDLKGVRELTLEVDFGRGGDVQDVVDWADARLVK